MVAVLLGCLLGLACRKDEAAGTPRPRRVVLVSIDTLRADHVGFMGAPSGATPQLDALAQRGTIFESTVSPAPLTLPAHTTLLTGLDPPRHGVHHNGLFSLDRAIPTLADHARTVGLRTAAFVGAVVLDRRYGLAAGFDHYDDRIEVGTGGDGGFAERSAEIVVDRALGWMGGSDGRFFAWIHLYDPHLPWNAPPAYGARVGDPYRAEIAHADAEIGRLVAGIESLWPDERTLWVVTSDHGESLGEHGERSHAYMVYEATQRVPLLLAGPGIAKGRRVRDLARLSDVVPTVLTLLGATPDSRLDGRDLFEPSIAGGPRRHAYSETRATEFDHGWSSLYSIRDERFHFIRAPEPELYDLGSDPGELRNLAAEQPERARRMDALLDRALSVDRETGGRVELSPAQRAELAALGYLPALDDDVRPLGVVGGRSPHDGLREANRWLRGRQLLANGRSSAAFEILCGMRSSSPLVALDCSRAALSTGDAALAEERARAALGSHPDAERVMAEVLLLQRDYDEAESQLARAVTRYPDSGALLAALGRVAAAQGDVDRALSLYRRASTVRRPTYEGLAMASALLLRQHRLDEARELLARLDEPEAQRPEVVAELIDALRAADDIDGARRLLRRALQSYPDADVLERLLAPDLGVATPELLMLQGRRLLELGKPDRAYCVLTSVDRHDSILELDRAWAAARSGRLAEARTYAERVRGSRWKDVTVAEILIRNGEWDGAERLVRDLQKRGLPYSNLKTMLGRIAEGRGERERAIEIYRDAGRGERPGLEALWRWAALEIEAGRREAAESALSGFHRVDPYANARLVEAELAAGSVERARQRLFDALTRHPDAEALVSLEARIEGSGPHD